MGNALCSPFLCLKIPAGYTEVFDAVRVSSEDLFRKQRKKFPHRRFSDGKCVRGKDIENPPSGKGKGGVCRNGTLLSGRRGETEEIISWRTEERDVLSSSRTSFFPSCSDLS